MEIVNLSRARRAWRAPLRADEELAVLTLKPTVGAAVNSVFSAMRNRTSRGRGGGRARERPADRSTPAGRQGLGGLTTHASRLRRIVRIIPKPGTATPFKGSPATPTERLEQLRHRT